MQLLPEKYLIEWEGIPLTLHLQRHYSAAFEKLYGDELVHITIRADERLPMTETGYRSGFLTMREVSDAGGLVRFVIGCLDEYAQKPSWQAYLQTRQQLTLF